MSCLARVKIPGANWKQWRNAFQCVPVHVYFSHNLGTSAALTGTVVHDIRTTFTWRQKFSTNFQ